MPKKAKCPNDLKTCNCIDDHRCRKDAKTAKECWRNYNNYKKREEK